MALGAEKESAANVTFWCRKSPTDRVCIASYPATRGYNRGDSVKDLHLPLGRLLLRDEQRNLGRVGMLVACLTASTTAFAQTPMTVDLRYESLQVASERNQGTPGNEFGDRHNPETGSLSFEVVDVSLPGNNALPVEFRRAYKATDKSVDGATESRLGDWYLDLPRIEASFLRSQGWITSSNSRPQSNCSIETVSDMVPPADSTEPVIFNSYTFWSPAQLNLPGQSSSLLVYRNGSMPEPASGGPYFWVTKNLSYASCLTALKNAAPPTAPDEEKLFGRGEGYLVRTSDGTKYWFDWMAVQSFTNMASQKFYMLGGSTTALDIYKTRVNMALYATRVEDRFGNWVTYSYSNKSNVGIKLDSIQSSDGRSIVIAHSGARISTVSANGRTWSYVFGGSFNELIKVTQPDSSSWIYSGSPSGSRPTMAGPFDGSCDYPERWMYRINPGLMADDSGSGFYQVQTPSGAIGRFEFDVAMLGRSGVPKSCYLSGWAVPSPNSPARSLIEQSVRTGAYVVVLKRKIVSGAGIATARWRYAYQSDISWLPETGGVTRSKILNPDGSLTSLEFGNVYNANEGLLLKKEISSPDGAILSQQTYQYLLPLKAIGQHPYAAREGYADTFIRPEIQSVTTMQGRRFLRSVRQSCVGAVQSYCFDAFGRPTETLKESANAQ